MSKSKSLSQLEKLEGINRQQKLIIQILCDAYNCPKNKGKLYDIIRQFCALEQEGTDGFEQLKSPKSKTSSKVADDGKSKKIKQLEQEIADQDEAYTKLEKQLLEYNEQAKHYEDMLAKNEKEKADLLANFQRQANVSQCNNSSIAYKQLETKAEELAAECERMKKQSHDAKQLCHEIQDELRRSREECKTLEKQIEVAKQQLKNTDKSVDNETLKAQITEQEQLIEQLNKEIDEANDEITRLKRENQTLRDRLLHSDSD